MKNWKGNIKKSEQLPEKPGASSRHTGFDNKNVNTVSFFDLIVVNCVN